MRAMACARSTAGPRPKLRPMQPSPMAETSSPFLPSVRFSIAAISSVQCCSRLGNRATIGLERDAVGLRSPTYAGLEGIDRRDLLARELEVEDIEVLGDALALDRLRNRGAAFLQMPAQHHLGGGLAVLPRDRE